MITKRKKSTNEQLGRVKLQLVSFGIEKEFIKEFERIAEEQDVSRSSVIRDIIREYFSMKEASNNTSKEEQLSLLN